MGITGIFALIALVGLLCCGLQIIAVRKTLMKGILPTGSQGAAGNSERPQAGISILKPLKGLDDDLFDNLTSFCMLDYPEYEVLFALQDYNDPAYKVAKKVKDRHPERDISIIVEKCSAGLNPKVNNLMPAYRVSKYELILISDSNVSVGKDYLTEIAGLMRDPEVGLVSNVIKGSGGNSLGSILENLHLNSFVVGSVCFLDRYLKMPCVIGKSMLMRKPDLEAIGGFAAVKDVLAEDFVLGERMHRNNKKVLLSHYLVQNVNKYWSVRRFLNRHTRWGKLRRHIGGLKYLSELVANPVFISTVPLMVSGPETETLTLALLVGLIKASCDMYLGKLIASAEGGFERCSARYLLSPVKDILIGFIWFVPLFSSTVSWRGNTYRICKDSMLLPCRERGALSGRLVSAYTGLQRSVFMGTMRLIYSIKERFA